MNAAISVRQSTLEECKASSYDVMIAASGYEERASFIAKELSGKAHSRLVLGFADPVQSDTRDQNDLAFRELGFSVQVASGNEYRECISALEEVLSKHNESEIHIAVDYSCMTRAWLWAIIRYLAEVSRTRRLAISMMYSVAEFSKPPSTPHAAQFVGPVPGISLGLQLPNDPIALIVGLGYELDMAMGLVEFLEPRKKWLFYAQPGSDERYVEEVMRANRQLFRSIDQENVVAYSLHDMLFTYAQLKSLVSGLVRAHRVVIAPMGPKPFSMLSMLVTLQFPGVDIWRVSSGTNLPRDRRPATGAVLTLDISMDHHASTSLPSISI